ncbi:ABC transporter ATP-binding protein [Longispora fulva]|uniref:ABC-type quaternary amine transporter n=1 Tax=Longispora fulva TaxID=619741 RepID=A0A8J7GUI1_9ACTN|nr:ABC transporter ATP-binding protein [Longispora fulva]MBG6138704.1 putative spermidine/putrescine transport system ATP-binding protein [Longispora fulva]GIG58197.1 ABC transporter ATP-binding protein [Longispora fulva]
MTAVTMSGLRRSFGDVAALDGLDLAIAPGELVALLGPSGCGKTTALRVLAGFETVDSGSVLVGDADITRVPAAKRDMGMVFQAFSLFPNLNALENVAFGLRVRKVAPAARRAKATELLELVGLGDKAKAFPHQLSGGQQQRVALARALAIEPRVLLLDEPLSALDAQVRTQLRDEIRRIQQRLGTTTLFVTHDQSEALSIADRVAVLRAGKVEQLASPDELYHRPATAFVAEFVGTTNRLPARRVSPAAVEVFGSTRDLAGDGDTEILVRPEALTVVADETGEVLIAARTFHGALTRLALTLPGGQEIVADVPSPLAGGLVPGVRVRVALLADVPMLAA